MHDRTKSIDAGYELIDAVLLRDSEPILFRYQ
jgi:hypothetical protein